MSGAARNVEDYWAQQLEVMRHLPSAVHRREPESIHDLRAAGRRLKATVVVFQPLLEQARAEQLIEELDRYNSILGQARDAEVTRDLLVELVGQAPEAQPLVDELTRTAEQLATQADVMLAERRTTALIGLVRRFTRKPWRSRAISRRRRNKQLRHRLDWAEERVAAAWRQLPEHAGERTAWEHRTRRRAKVARYAIEALGSAVPDHEQRVADYVRLVDLLGQIQDGVVMERVLAGRSGQAVTAALAEQRRRSAEAEAAVPDAMRQVLAHRR